MIAIATIAAAVLIAALAITAYFGIYWMDYLLSNMEIDLTDDDDE